jgi:hypothetical protein
MTRRRGAFAFGVGLAFVLAVAAFAQEKVDQKKENPLLIKIADDVSAGRPVPNDLSLAWVNEDFMKGPQGKEFVPFTVTIDPAKAASGTVMVYWRVVPKGDAAAAPAAPAGKKDDKKKSDVAWESAGSFSVAGAPNPMRVSRSFTVPAGAYDVYVVMKEPTPDKAPKNAPAPKVSALKQTVTVPDYWNDELNTSSVIMTQKIDPLPAPLTKEQLIERPYDALGIDIVPAASSKLTKKDELSVFLLVYNAKPDAMNKPDVLIEYSFCQAAPGNQPKPDEPCKMGEKFFNKTMPESLNAQTLPPQFDLSAGHQLQTGQAVPLSAFPEGDYRLEIKITDKLANKTISKDVNFSVTS